MLSLKTFWRRTENLWWYLLNLIVVNDFPSPTRKEALILFGSKISCQTHTD